ncbi:MAG: EAL domain-containing protein [Desulfobacteraceae bacterium]|nr:EAL domain-containing protein [Desulfobacteraceae bacterium]
MLAEIFKNHLDFVFFIYGGAFFFAGLAILIQSHTESEIKLSRVIPWLGIFGLLHGFNEWLDMWQLIRDLPVFFKTAGPFLLLVSYMPLLEFGRRAINTCVLQTGTRTSLTVFLRPWIHPVLIMLVFLGGLPANDFLTGISVCSRYMFGFPGAFLAGAAFLWSMRIYRHEILNLGSGLPFYFTGAAFLIYALLGGLIGPGEKFFPAAVLNTDMFLHVFNVPVQLLRAVCAVTVLAGISFILRLFRIETFYKLKQEEKEILRLNSELEQRVKTRTAELEAEIEERKKIAERLDYIAYFDDLTGLPNRTLFRDRLQQAIAKAKRSGARVGVLLIDIDRLQAVNDSLGHQAGNRLIRETARRIRSSVREGDTVARFSGDEFTVIADPVDSAELVLQMGERIRKAINQPCELSGTQIYPDCSIGFTIYPDYSMDLDTLLKQANMAVYEAKKNSFAKIQGFVEQEDWVSQQFYLENELRGALERKEFILYYQPKVDLESGDLIGVEALLRWQHPVRGLISPGEFIPVLEKTGMIVPVSRWVVNQACGQIKTWQEHGFHTRVSVNISARQFGDEHLINMIRESLTNTDVQAKYLEIELTETLLMQHVSRAAVILETLSDWGIKVALDDFGKGYSSLSYLQQLALDTIKLDKQFVTGLPDNKDDMVLAQTIVNMAHNLGKKILAEGVETQDQLKALQEMGCDYAQGFLFGRPTPPEQILAKYSSGPVFISKEQYK